MDNQNWKRTVHQLSVIFSSCLLLLLGCSPPQSFQPIHWEASSGEPLPEAMNSPQFAIQDRSAAYSDLLVARSLQRHEGLIVAGGYLKKIYNRSTGKLVRVRGKQQDQASFPDKDKLEKFMGKTYLLLEQAKIKSEELKNSSQIFEPQWVLDDRWNRPQVVLRVAFINKEETRAKEIDLTVSGQIVATRDVSHYLDEGVGRVFPLSPLTSPLSDVTLKNLTGTGTLSTPYLSVTSDSQQAAFSKNHVFKYEPGQDAFDQVQAFYHMDRFLSHYRDTHQVTLPFALTAKVHVGYPERKNAAFYYQGNIRLGSGDGEVYEHMSEDPSIVMHEAAHGIVDAFAGLSFGEEEGSINEGFADFFAANLLNSPRMAEASYLKGPYKRTLENNRTLDQRNGGLYHDSLIWSGTLWDIRTLIGQKKSADFAFRILSHLGPGSNFADLKEALQLGLEQETPETRKHISSVLTQRGWQ